MMLALIMAGGFGKRLRPLTDKTPKTLLPVGGKPIIYWQIKWLESHGIDKFLLLGGYKADQIIRYIKSIGYHDNFDFSIENKPLGTAGAIKNAEKLINGEKSFIVNNGDNITDQDISRLKLGKGHLGCVSLAPYRSSKGIAEIKGNSITNFREKPILEGIWFNAGTYLLSGKLLKLLPKKGSLEQEIFPKLAKRGMLSCVTFRNSYFNAVDSFKDLEEIDRDISTRKIKFS